MATAEQITALYAGYFNRAPDPEGLNYWLTNPENMTIAEIAESFSKQPEATALYPFLKFPEINSPTAFINQVYANLFNREADAEGLEYWTDQLDQGTPVGEMIADIMSGAQDGEFPDATILGNKVEAGLGWTSGVAAIPGFSYVDEDGVPIPSAENAAKDVLDGVDETDASVEAAAEKTAAYVESVVEGGGTGGGMSMSLTVGADDLTGSGSDDVFEARVAQNQNGEQANQLGTGDQIDGGAGNDTLAAKMQVASALNDEPASAVAPETVDVEDILITALSFENDFEGGRGYFGYCGPRYSGSFKPDVEVALNAQFMNGVDTFGSVDSNADLVVYNANTLTDSGEWEDRRNTSEMTVRMDHTGGETIVDLFSDYGRIFDVGKGFGGEDKFGFGGEDNDAFYEDPADLTVLFDQDYLISGQSNASEALFFLLDERAEFTLLTGGTSDGRLDNIDRDGLIIGSGGQVVEIEIDVPLSEINSHQEFVDALQADLDAKILAGELPMGTTITLEQPPFNSIFGEDPQNGNIIELNRTGLEEGLISDFIPAIIVTSGDGSEIDALGYSRPDDLTGFFDVYGVFTDEVLTEDLPISIDVDLFKVGRAQDGGELVIGSMDSDGLNYFNGGPGIEVFNVLVEGDDDQDSSLAGMRSTNNTLEQINVGNVEGSLADLTIGNQFGFGIKDVRDFLASSFENDITLHAVLTDEIVDKYMNLADPAENPFLGGNAGATNDADADDIEFNYQFGGGDDSLYMAMTDNNEVFNGSSNREDFEMNISMGDGDDFVDLFVGMAGEDDTDGTGWYVNHVVDKNGDETGRGDLDENGVYVETGNGNDFVWVQCASAVQIDAGADNDVVYTDNSEDTAEWYFNSRNSNVNDLLSASEVSVGTVANLGLRVEYLGIESGLIEVGDTDNSLSGETITDLDINQAIKDAINNDDVLNKLIIATDGPGRTLVIESLTDGVKSAIDLSIALEDIDPLSPSQVNGTARLWSELTAAEQTRMGFDGTGAAIADGRWDTASRQSDTGDDSDQWNHNTVEGGLGDDVIVLSTEDQSDSFSGLSNISTETIDIDGLFGDDTIVNFKAAGNAGAVNLVTTAADDLTKDNAGGSGTTDPVNGIYGDGSAAGQGQGGFDIFDVSDVLGGQAQGVENVVDGAVDNITGASTTDLAARWVYLDDQGDRDGDATTGRIAELTAEYNAIDGGAGEDNLVILVDGDNTGTFYHIQNGAGAADITVVELGSVELAQYDADNGIGNWDQMTIDNFYALEQVELLGLADVFDVS